MSDPAMRPDELRALGAFFEGRAERILSVAAQLKQARRQIVSRVQGTSMGQCLPDGSQVLIQLTEDEDYQPGDILAFLIGARVTVHRLLRRAGRWPRREVLITAGDDRAFPDPPVHVESVLGRVVGVGSEGDWVAPPAPAGRRLWARCVSASLARSFALFGLGGYRFAAAAADRVYRVLHVRGAVHRTLLRPD